MAMKRGQLFTIPQAAQAYPGVLTERLIRRLVADRRIAFSYAGRRIILHLKNDDPLSEEFDSSALKVEKVFAGNSEGIIRISPLDPGRYEFMGEYHSDTAKGVVIAE